MQPPFHDLMQCLDPLSAPIPPLREGIRQAVALAPLDAEMALTRTRKVLEYMVRRVYERCLNEPPGTRELGPLLQRIVKDNHLPRDLAAYANAVRELGNVGTHSFEGRVTVQDVFRALEQLTPIVQWFLTTEGTIAPQPASLQTSLPAEYLAVMPKGLRSFDAGDQGFFLALLPGPRDQDGLPEAVRFWKHRIETTAEPSFTIGLLYGPSGSGKSSLLKAGILPRLAGRVLTVYVEATAEETESRLLKGLRQRYPGLPTDAGLSASLAAVRSGQHRQPEEKVLLVLDQLEQWLHAHPAAGKSDLVQALRQCDGEHVQCLVLVRDDFWMAATRFLDALDIALDAQNSAAVDLFDTAHARQVLAAFGRAFGKLPEGEPESEQGRFLDQAVAEFAQDGKVIAVHLSLLAQMLKDREWTPTTLQEVGGLKGIGVTFLEETFCTAAAQPRHRLHQLAARAVLDALLPEPGTDLKGHRQTHQQLLAVSGYARQPERFEDLLRCLDELRLLTPADPEEAPLEGQPAAAYQLTHDALVPALREWLTRRQRETWPGRAELRLAERTALWSAHPEARHLPAGWEWANIGLGTRWRTWTPPQRRLMRAATRYHVQRGLWALLLLWGIALGFWGWQYRHEEERRANLADALVVRLLDAEIARVPGIIGEMAPYRRWVSPRLKEIQQRPEITDESRLRIALALLPEDPSQADYLAQRLLDAELPEVAVLREALRDRPEIAQQLWTVLEDPHRKAKARFRAGLGLAAPEDADPRWQRQADFLARQCLAEALTDPAHYQLLRDGLRPVRAVLRPPLADLFRTAPSDSERRLATNLLKDYAVDQPVLLTELALDADPWQFAQLLPLLQEQAGPAVQRLEQELEQPAAAEPDREAQARRQAQAAVALLHLNQPQRIWPLFRHSPDPRARTYLIHRLRPLDTNPAALVQRLDEEPDVTAQRGLLLSLGEFAPQQLAADSRAALIDKVVQLYEHAPDAGVHGAAEWLLRQWQQPDRLKEIERKLMTGKIADGRQWYVNGQGQTFTVFRDPQPFPMGSPPDESDRTRAEERHLRAIPYSFALASKEVTNAQFQRFRKERGSAKNDYSPEAECPAVQLSWFEAAEYCNWLSKQEGLTPCYPEPIQPGMKLPEDFLKRDGYRLPTEAEWEYACRAGAVTSRAFGTSEEMLPHYAWYTANTKNQRSWPVGRLKPNDWGLFDMYGNAMEWCQDRMLPYPEEDRELLVQEKEPRVMRGGSFTNLPGSLRSAARFRDVPTNQDARVGFRVARTLP